MKPTDHFIFTFDAYFEYLISARWNKCTEMLSSYQSTSFEKIRLNETKFEIDLIRDSRIENYPHTTTGIVETIDVSTPYLCMKIGYSINGVDVFTPFSI